MGQGYKDKTRKSDILAEKVRRAVEMIDNSHATVALACKTFGLHRSTFYRLTGRNSKAKS